MSIYNEKIKFYFLYYAILIPVAILIFIRFTAGEDVPSQAIIFLLVLFAILYYLFYELHITITNDEMDFGFNMFRTRIKRNDIISCTPVNIKFGTYLGMGIRYGLDGTKAYNTRFGKAIRIKVKGRKRDFVITTNRAEQICSIIGKK